ncbi:MAG: GPW/gp25 family protein [Nitrosomonas sp.]|nr:GPW/gp25 family protein [Nitrosomonas sp.]MCW5607861.1 GPW/gp25 family protein [Nitrosomonas sp.]
MPKLNTAWRFNHPDSGAQGTGMGLYVEPSGKIAMTSSRAAIRQSILLLMSTIPGERVMRPQYGCDLHQLAFMPNDATTHGLAIHYVRTALERWEPRIDIIHIDANTNADDPSLMDITLKYRIRKLKQPEQLIIAYHLMGAET